MLTANPASGYGFSSWSGDANGTNNPLDITMTSNMVITANFVLATAVETLTFGNVSRIAPVGMPAVLVDGEFVVTGAVTRLSSARISILTTFPNGTVLYTLDGSAPSFLSSLYGGPFQLRNSATIQAIAYDAIFSRSWEADPVQVVVVPTYLLNVSTAGGGSVTATPALNLYTNNSLVGLTATPAAGWSFLGWQGDVAGTNATSNLVVTRDKCVEAVFGTGFSNTIEGGGSLSIKPAGPYPYGTVVKLTAVPDIGNYFALWGNAASSTNNPLNFTVTNAGNFQPPWTPLGSMLNSLGTVRINDPFLTNRTHRFYRASRVE
jgi:hypothetical protein